MTWTEGGSRLPTLTPALVRHSEQVEALVRQRVLQAPGHWLAFDEFVRIVQYQPGLGYYSAGSEKLGAAGDFITAPELSPLFGRCLARQCAQVLAQFPSQSAQILELGAGSGALAEVMLLSLQELGQLPQQYWILEVSADLRARQQQRLAALPADLAGRVRWLDSLPSAAFSGVIVANEVLDALPFKRFRLDGGAVSEYGIGLSADGCLAEATRVADDSLRAEIERLAAWPIASAHDYVSELCPMLEPWTAALAATLAAGAVLFVDYGLARRDYYHPQRTRGTMRCHFRHRAHEDALLHLGLQDISAWVDFTRVAEAASAVGLDVSGYCTQAAFLLATGIEHDLGAPTTSIDQARLAGQARVLLLPGEMGENFKVMALTRSIDIPLTGFRHQDLRASL